MNKTEQLRDVYFVIPSFGMTEPEFLCQMSWFDIDLKRLHDKKRKDGIVYFVCMVGEKS